MSHYVSQDNEFETRWNDLTVQEQDDVTAVMNLCSNGMAVGDQKFEKPGITRDCRGTCKTLRVEKSVLDPVSDTLGLLRCETDGERGLKTFGWRFPPIRRFSRGGGRVLTPWKIVFDGLLGDPLESARAPDERDQEF